MKAALPPNEAQRLATLQGYDILDTPPEAGFDDLALLASQICQTPVALVSFVDENRQWFKSRIGLSATETPRDYSFCAHAILLSDEVLEVRDARLDARFADNPLVTDDPNILFYAGAPLVTQDNSALGTLCVIDFEPRELSAAQKLSLQALGRHVVALLELRRSLAENKNIMEDLRGSEARFHDLVENANDLIQICDRDGALLYVNRAWCETLGYSKTEIAGLTLQDIIHPDSLDHCMEQLLQVVAEKELTGVEAVFQAKDGHKVFVEGSATCGINDSKQLSTRSIFRDVSERKHEEQCFHDVVEASPSGLVMVSETGGITLVNVETEKLFGYTRTELIGQPVEILLPVRFRASHPTKRHEFFADPRSRGMGTGRDLYGLRKDGSEFALEIGLSPLHTPEGMTVLATVVDITQRKQAEHMLRTKNEELKDFAYTVSHDLKAPLRGISGYAQELERRHQAGLTERAQFCIKQIITASHNLDGLIEDLLTYSRVDSETPTVTEVDLSVMMKGIMRDRSLTVAEQGVEMTVNVPAITMEIWERGLHQVLTNLIDNAIKYSRNAKPARLTISAEKTPTACLIAVKDNGIGFDTKYHDRIFGLFNRLVRADEFEGTGAGLAIVRKLVDKLGGTVGAESEPGKGATFFVELPITASRKPLP